MKVFKLPEKLFKLATKASALLEKA